MSLLSRLRAAFWRCAACDVAASAVFCATCALSLKTASAPLQQAPDWSAYAYGGAMGQAICRAKYAGRSELWAPLSLSFAALEPELRRWQPASLVPVPSHWTRLAARGHNPAALLAAPLGIRLGVPIDHGAMQRILRSAPQAALPRTQRVQIDRRTFRASPKRLEGQRILLLDDVRTTGATLAAAKAALLLAGASEVATLTLAVSET